MKFMIDLKILEISLYIITLLELKCIRDKFLIDYSMLTVYVCIYIVLHATAHIKFNGY